MKDLLQQSNFRSSYNVNVRKSVTVDFKLTDFLYIVGISKYSFEWSVTITNGGEVTFLNALIAMSAIIAKTVIDNTVHISRAVYLSIN